MPSTSEYVQFSTRVYDASEINDIGIPSGWDEIDWQPDIWDGFSAGAYLNKATNELVISFTGTNSSIADPLNWLAAVGVPAPQIFDAINYYFRFKNEYPDANITFTGHSLGGGLASIMSVFFDKAATVFNEAPFQIAAMNPVVYLAAFANMVASGNWDSRFNDYWLSLGLLALTRESNITHYSVEGEALSTIRSSLTTLVGDDVPPISLGDSTAGAIERHSMSLLTALWTSSSFLNAAQKLPDLVTQLLDTNIYATDPRDEQKEDLLRKLLAHQLGILGTIQPDGMLDRFASDLQKIAQPGGLTMSDTNLTKALTLFAMQMYYKNPNATDVDTTLFDDDGVTGGIHFDREDVANTLNEVQGKPKGDAACYFSIDTICQDGTFCPCHA